MLTLHTNLNPGEIGEKPTTQLTGFDFNSYCKFNGRFLGLSSTALCAIGGDTKNGANIDAYLETFNTKFGYDGMKRLRYIYIGIETTGTIQIVITADGVDTSTIDVVPQKTGRQYIRVTVGRDLKGCYWNFRIQNVNGCRFSLDAVKAMPVYLSFGKNSY